jgi:hypothetical protein
MPESSRPGTSKSRALREPIARMVASKSFLSESAVRSVPTFTLVLNVTPSAFICSMRRSTKDFSILKSGMP